MDETAKIPLANFLKLLASNNKPAKAMAIAGKIYKEFNTPAKLAKLTDIKLIASGVEDKEDRKLVMAAMRKAGYVTSPKKISSTSLDSSSVPSTSSLTTPEALITPTKRKRKPAVSEKNEFLPSGPPDEDSEYRSFEFNEVLDESILHSKYCVVNRAPLMTAWSTIVAERMGFEREEALSIASSYTEMNAIAKGVSLGIYKDGKQKGLEAVKGGTQPYVDIMGRRPLYQIHNDRWRALHSGAPTHPNTAFSYISRSLRQTMPFIIGALRLLANSFSPQEINEKGWGLYTQFRPAVEGWGNRSEVRCAVILALRNPPSVANASEGRQDTEQKAVDVVKYEPLDGDSEEPGSESPESNRTKGGLTLEEYEAALDEDHTFDDIDLDNLP
ncbi:hypothetical protein BT96DRAFT_984149 [Gymnopus androsaceus JB14]|uniref:Uncharacterized protein n=1 Tax=Gymnopus androsaceus JB14 TaxID=1447944 RepID=A0A6A4IEE4_9AGAR|nr:hypothetical protein BT96DRAFT_984149 [Gymnopus androsaceus JB14]